MNEKKVAFVCIEGIHGLLDPNENFSISIGLYPKGENSSGKIVFTEKREPKCNTTWSLIYHSELDEFISISLSLKNNEYAKLLLPIKWFEVNKVVKESFPMLVTYQKIDKEANIMMTVLVHRSENGECAFLADQGHLLVKPEWNTNQIESSCNDNQKSASNVQQELTKPQQMVYFIPGQQAYMVPMSNSVNQNQVLIPMQIQGQFLNQMPFAANPYQYPVQPFICTPDNQYQINQPIDQQQIQNSQIQSSHVQESPDINEQKETTDNIIQKDIECIDKNIQEVQLDQNSKEIDQNLQKIQNDQKDGLNEDNQADQNGKKDQNHNDQVVDEKPKKAKTTQDIQKTDRKSKKDQQNQNQEVEQKVKKSQANSDIPKSAPKAKKQSSPNNQKDKKGQLNQDSQKTDQKSKKVQLSTDSPKVEQKAKKVVSKDPIPVLQPITVYIKTQDGKFKPMLLIPSTKDAPAQLKHINQQKQ